MEVVGGVGSISVLGRTMRGRRRGGEVRFTAVLGVGLCVVVQSSLSVYGIVIVIVFVRSVER